MPITKGKLAVIAGIAYAAVIAVSPDKWKPLVFYLGLWVIILCGLGWLFSSVRPLDRFRTSSKGKSPMTILIVALVGATLSVLLWLGTNPLGQEKGLDVVVPTPTPSPTVPPAVPPPTPSPLPPATENVPRPRFSDSDARVVQDKPVNLAPDADPKKFVLTVFIPVTNVGNHAAQDFACTIIALDQGFKQFPYQIGPNETPNRIEPGAQFVIQMRNATTLTDPTLMAPSYFYVQLEYNDAELPERKRYRQFLYFRWGDQKAFLAGTEIRSNLLEWVSSSEIAEIRATIARAKIEIPDK